MYDKILVILKMSSRQPSKRINNAIRSNMDRSRDCHTECSKSEMEKISYDISYKWNLKRNDNKWSHLLYLHREESSGCQGKDEGKG